LEGDVKDYYSITEFAELSGIEASTLRYWDEIGLFSPVKRMPENNYRAYSAVQLLALNFVDTLSKLDIPLKTIGELRNNRDPETLLRVLERKERELDMELRHIRECSSIIHARQELIRNGIKVKNDSEIFVMEIKEDKTFLLWPRNEYNEGETFIEPLTAFISQTNEHRINLGFPVGGLYDSLDAFMKAPKQPGYFTSMDPTGTHIRKAGRYLAGYSRGYYGEMGDLPERMHNYTQENSVKTKGPVYAAYQIEETCEQDTSRYLAQCYIALA
jgi:DNA-binding transcriptional MerR regulator